MCRDKVIQMVQRLRTEISNEIKTESFYFQKAKYFLQVGKICDDRKEE